MRLKIWKCLKPSNDEIKETALTIVNSRRDSGLSYTDIRIVAQSLTKDNVIGEFKKTRSWTETDLLKLGLAIINVIDSQTMESKTINEMIEAIEGVVCIRKIWRSVSGWGMAFIEDEVNGDKYSGTIYRYYPTIEECVKTAHAYWVNKENVPGYPAIE